MLNNVIDSIFSTTSTLTAGGFIVCLLVSLALGVLIAVCSRYRNRPSKSLSVSLVLLPMIVQTIIALVNGQLGAGIAVAGAFSLVRFRSAPASAREITSIFLAMAVGLATGMGYIAIAVILAVFVLLVDIALASINFGKAGSAERDLKIVIPESLSYDEVFNDIFSTYTSRHELIRVKTTNMGSLFKLTYQITLRDARKEKEFIDKLRERNGNLEITCARPGNGNVEILSFFISLSFAASIAVIKNAQPPAIAFRLCLLFKLLLKFSFCLSLKYEFQVPNLRILRRLVREGILCKSHDTRDGKADGKSRCDVLPGSPPQRIS